MRLLRTCMQNICVRRARKEFGPEARAGVEMASDGSRMGEQNEPPTPSSDGYTVVTILVCL